MEPEPITFRRHTDPETGAETHTVIHPWPRTIAIDLDLSAGCSGAPIAVDGDTLTFTVSNGHAVYRLARDEATVMYGAWVVPAYLVSSRYTEAG